MDHVSTNSVLNVLKHHITENASIRIIVIASIIVAAAVILIILFFFRKKKKTATNNANDTLHMKIEMLRGKNRSKNKSFHLTNNVTIGSSRKNDISLDGKGIESFHARIYLENNRVSIEDLGSVSGVTIGGMRIQDRNPLRNGDVIGIGDTEFTVTFQKSLGENVNE